MSCGISRPTNAPIQKRKVKKSVGNVTWAKTDGNCLMICHASTVILARIMKLLPPPIASVYSFATPIALTLWGVGGG